MEIVSELLRRINPGHVLEDPGVVESAAYLDLLALCGLVAALGLILTIRPQLLFGVRPFEGQLARRYGGWLAWLGGFGLLAVGLRYTGAPFFAKRLWLMLDLLGILAVTAHFIWYRFTRFRSDLAHYDQDFRRRQARRTRRR